MLLLKEGTSWMPPCWQTRYLKVIDTLLKRKEKGVLRKLDIERPMIK